MFAALGLSACKKSSGDAAVDNTAFKNTIWTGEFNYTGKTAEPVSIDFSEGGQLLWHELKGNRIGTWKLEGKKLSISLDNAPSFTGDVTSDNKLTNLQTSDGGGRTLKNAALDKAAIPDLANTVWAADNVSLKFKAGGKLDLFFGPPVGFPTYMDLNYTVSGRAIHFDALADYNWFAVINGGASLKGTNHAPNDPTVYVFTVVKQ